MYFVELRRFVHVLPCTSLRGVFLYKKLSQQDKARFQSIFLGGVLKFQKKISGGLFNNMKT